MWGMVKVDFLFKLSSAQILSSACKKTTNDYYIWFPFLTAPPVFINPPPTFVEVLLGDSLTLSCGAHGNPRPTVVWHKDNSPIQKHEKIKVRITAMYALVNPFVFYCYVSLFIFDSTFQLFFCQLLSGTLSLASVTRNTSGVYICHVSNSVGNLTHSLQLQVKGQFQIVSNWREA